MFGQRASSGPLRSSSAWLLQWLVRVQLVDISTVPSALCLLTLVLACIRCGPGVAWIYTYPWIQAWIPPFDKYRNTVVYALQLYPQYPVSGNTGRGKYPQYQVQYPPGGSPASSCPHITEEIAHSCHHSAVDSTADHLTTPHPPPSFSQHPSFLQRLDEPDGPASSASMSAASSPSSSSSASSSSTSISIGWATS